MKSTPQAILKRYNELTGFNLEYSIAKDYWLSQFCLRFGVEDLELLIRHIKRNKAKGRPARSLLFRSIFGGMDSIEFAEQDINEARIESRTRPITPRDKILKQVGREPEPMRPVRTAESIMMDMALMKRLKEKEGL